jgi:hypothetical protein
MNMDIKLLALVGRKRTGKDTVAEYLIDNHNYVKYSFADPIKKGVMEMFGFTESQMWGSEEDKETIDPRWGISPRRMLQLMGTELLQYDIHKHTKENEFNMGREIWVNRFRIWYKDQVSKNNELKVVVPDLRFPHEEKVIKELGGVVWRIDRPSLTNKDTHSSENEMDIIVPNKVIINDGSLEELYEKIILNPI